MHRLQRLASAARSPCTPCAVGRERQGDPAAAEDAHPFPASTSITQPRAGSLPG